MRVTVKIGYFLLAGGEDPTTERDISSEMHLCWARDKQTDVQTDGSQHGLYPYRRKDHNNGGSVLDHSI